MSEKLLYAAGIANDAASLLVILCGIIWIGWILYQFVCFLIERKNNKTRDEIKEKKEVYEKRIAEISREQDDGKISYADYLKQSKEIREESEVDPEVMALQQTIKKREKFQNNTVNTFFAVSGGMAGFFMVISFILMIIYGWSYGGKVREIQKVECNDNVCVSAYYEVDYTNVNQSTITVFVKNNSGKDVKSATIVEKNSKSNTVVKNLDSGEEKIGSFVVYDKDDVKYEFEVVDVQYVE